MDYELTGNTLNVRLRRDFNLLTTRRIERLARDADVVRIDLSRSKIADSEAVILLYKLITAGKEVKLKNPPPIFEEVIHLLGLEPIFDLDTLVERTGNTL